MPPVWPAVCGFYLVGSAITSNGWDALMFMIGMIGIAMVVSEWMRP